EAVAPCARAASTAVPRSPHRLALRIGSGDTDAPPGCIGLRHACHVDLSHLAIAEAEHADAQIHTQERQVAGRLCLIAWQQKLDCRQPIVDLKYLDMAAQP